MTHSYAYDSAFLNYTATTSRYAGKKVVDLLVSEFDPKSVLDVGCAGGAWLAAWQQSGINDCFGVDGDYIDPEQLLIDRTQFQSADLSKPFALGRRFDLVQCLEVAEHIEASSADALIDSITHHAERFVLFSAAPPGQGGENHVNEQTYGHWRSAFARRGFDAFDFIRPAILGDSNVSFWYRYNMLLYVRREHVSSLSSAVAKTMIPITTEVVDVSPALFQLRKFVVRTLPKPLVYALARFKARLLRTGRL
jgi:SAM-dependent methyltransferase